MYILVYSRGFLVYHNSDSATPMTIIVHSVTLFSAKRNGVDRHDF